MLTYERLIEVVDYFPDTGKFIRKIAAGRLKIGDECGSHQNKGYVQIYIDGKNYLAHRLAWFFVYKKWPTYQIDHINRNKKDNRINNLRDVSASENQHNNGLRKHNSSGFTGVMFDSKKKLYVAQIYVKTKRIYLGSFKSKEMAIKSRKFYEAQII